MIYITDRGIPLLKYFCAPLKIIIQLMILKRECILSSINFLDLNNVVGHCRNMVYTLLRCIPVALPHSSRLFYEYFIAFTRYGFIIIFGSRISHLIYFKNKWMSAYLTKFTTFFFVILSKFNRQFFLGNQEWWRIFWNFASDYVF